MRGELRDFEWAAMTGCRQYLAFIKFASIRIWLRARACTHQAAGRLISSLPPTAAEKRISHEVEDRLGVRCALRAAEQREGPLSDSCIAASCVLFNLLIALARKGVPGSQRYGLRRENRSPITAVRLTLASTCAEVAASLDARWFHCRIE